MQTEIQTVEPHPDRATYIGSADIAGIFGVPGAFSSPYEIAARKKRLIPPLEVNEAMEIGLALENYVLSRYEREERVKIGETQVFFRHPDWPIAGCTVDGLVFDDQSLPVRIVEAKTTGDFKWDDGVPLRYEAQVQWQMGVSGVAEADLTVLHLPNKQQKTYRVGFDAELFESMLDRAIEFWSLYCQTAKMPVVDGHSATTDALKQIRARAGKEVIVDGMADAVEALKAAKQKKKEAEALETELENLLKEALGEAEIGLIDGKPAFTWKEQKGKTTLDDKQLKADHPEIYEQYKRTGNPFRVLRMTGSK